MKVYIAGPISRNPGYEAKFKIRENRLKSNGHEVVNPVDIGKKLEEDSGGNVIYSDYIRAGLKALLECDGISFLHGWERSKGAKLERKVALMCRMKIIL